MIIRVVKAIPSAILPDKNPGDAGYDLFAAESVFFNSPLERILVSTGIKMEIPPGYYGHICDRSGMALKKGFHVLGGIVDSTYRGIVSVIIQNIDSAPASSAGNHMRPGKAIRAGDKIAQIIFKQHQNPAIVETDALSETDRGEGGFGSTGF